MRDYGTFFRRERQERGMRQCDLAEGICTVDTISRIETGNQTPSSVLFNLLIERLGVSGFSYGDFFGAETIHLMQLQRKIVDALDKRILDEIPFLLTEYRESMGRESWDEQFFVFARGWYFFLLCKDQREFMSVCEIAMRVMRPHYSFRQDVTEWNLIQNEYRILNAIAMSQYKRGNAYRGIALLNQLILNQKSGKDALPIYWQNLAVLYNNAALFERKQFPEEAFEHIRKAEKAVLHSGSPLMSIRINKTRLLHFYDGPDLRRWLKSLRDCFLFVNGALHIYHDFWDFLSESCLLNIL